MSINVNGREYGSWAEVPPEIRAKLASLPDKNGDGIPDVLQGDLSAFGSVGQSPDVTTVSTTTFAVNGVPYRSLADLPEVLRAEMDRAFQGLGDLGTAIIDATSTGGPPAAAPGPTGYAPPGTGFSAPAAPARDARPMMINGEPYEPEAGRKRWWQFWK